MNNEQDVCVVHIETREFLDECQNSYLPEMWPIFGVYSTREKADRLFGIISPIDIRGNTKYVTIPLTQKATIYSMTYVLREKTKYSKDAPSIVLPFL